MIRPHFKLAFRHILKGKYYSLLNISGLAVGMATAFLILQYLSFELGYDDIHKNQDQLYRVVSTKYENAEVTNTSATTFYGVSLALKEYFPEVEQTTCFYRWPASTGILMMSDGKIYNERKYVLADSTFFGVFPSMLWRGDPATCLSDPNSIVVSKKLAIKLFGTTDVIGKTVNTLDHQSQELVITAVMMDLPGNVHFDLDVVRPREWIPDSPWEYPNDHTYVTLRPDASIKDVESRLNEIAVRMRAKDSSVTNIVLTLQNIRDIHFHHQSGNEIKAGGDKTSVYIIGAIFVIVLVLAWINHINFETARFISRIKEVGLRRVIGSSKRDLITQFFIQYACMQVIAIVLAVGIVYMILPNFHFITGVPIDLTNLHFQTKGFPVPAFFIIGIFVTCFAPSFLLIKIDPAASLKGKINHTVNKTFARRSLVAVQYVSALTITALLIVIIQQIDFMREAKLNINLNHVLTVYNPTNYSSYEDSLRTEKNAAFRNQLLRNSNILNYTASSAIPGEAIGFTYVDLAKRTLNDADRQIPYKVVYIDYDFVPVMSLTIKAGRNFDKNRSEEGCLIVTESTIRELGFTSAEEAIDKEIYFMEDEWDKWKIIGVVEDYRHQAVKSPIHPTIFRLHKNKGQMVYYSMLLNPAASTAAAVSTIQSEWQSIWPEKQFDYFFLDDYYDQQFKSEMNMKRIFAWFSGIAILISCFGLLGMTLLDVNTRIKEVSIRKVLGATTTSLVALLSKDNVRSIGWAAAISIPIIYWLGLEWLSNYPAHVHVSVIALVAPVLLLVALAALTSGIQTIRTANSNPIEHLKSE